MAKGQLVAELGEDAAGAFGGIGLRNSVVQMDLDFSPASMAVIGEHLEQSLVVLLGGIEVGVDKRAAVVVSRAVDYFGIFACPRFQAPLLVVSRYALQMRFGIYHQ